MKVSYQPIDTVIEEYLSLTDDQSNIRKSTLKKWAHQLLSKITSHEQLEHKISLLYVKDRSVLLPDDFHSIVQVAFRNTCPERPRLPLKKVYEAAIGTFDGTGCQINMTMDCPNCTDIDSCNCTSGDIIVDINRFDEIANPQWFYGHMPWYRGHGGLINGERYYRSLFHPEFELIRPASHYFFNADHHVKGCLNLEEKLCARHPVEYQLDLPRMILNREGEEGEVLLSYLAVKYDKEGYRYVPDIESVYEAIKWQLEENVTYREWRKDRRQNQLFQAHQYARQRRIEAQARAREELILPDFQDWWTFIENHWMKKIPYYDFFEEHNRKKRDPYDDVMSRLTRHE